MRPIAELPSGLWWGGATLPGAWPLSAISDHRSDTRLTSLHFLCLRCGSFSGCWGVARWVKMSNCSVLMWIKLTAIRKCNISTLKNTRLNWKKLEMTNFCCMSSSGNPFDLSFYNITVAKKILLLLQRERHLAMLLSKMAAGLSWFASALSKAIGSSFHLEKKQLDIMTFLLD